MLEERRRRRLLASAAASAAAVLLTTPVALAARSYVPAGADVAPGASRPNQQLIDFFQSPAGVAIEVLALAAGGVAWTVLAAQWLERVEIPDRIPTSKSARKRARARRGPEPAGRAANLASGYRVVAGLVTAAALILPLTFSVLIGDNVFALPKFVALTAFGAVISIALIALLVFGARLPRPGVLEVSTVAFITLTAIATVVSVDPAHSVVGEPTHYQGLIASVGCVLLFIGAGTALTTLARVRILALAILASATVAALYALVQWFGFDPIWAELYKGRVFSTVGQANALATTLAGGAILAVALAPGTGRGQRLAIGGCAALCVAALVFTFSRGGYAAFAIGLSVACLVLLPGLQPVAVRRWAGPLVAAGVAVTVAVGLIVLVWQPAGEVASRVVERTASIADAREGSNRAHLDLWTVGLRIAIDHPVLGTGPDSYALVFPEYRDIVLPAESAAKMARFRPESPHNVYLAIASGSGFPALAAFVVLVGSCLVLGLRAVRRATMPARLALAGVLGALTVHLITIVFMTAEPATFALMWILLGALAGFSRGLLATSPDTHAFPAR